MGYTPTNSGRSKPNEGIIGRKPKPGMVARPLKPAKPVIKPAPKPGFGISPPKKRGMGR